MVPFILFPAGKILDGQTVDVGIPFLWNPACFFYFYFSIEPPPFFSFLFPPGTGSRASELQIKE